MKNFSVKVLCEIAIFAAIGFVLDILQGGLFKGVFASGGSIGIAMVPVLVISYRRGLVPGLLCGLLLSIVQMAGGIYVINGTTGWRQTVGPFIQIMLDYILAYTVVGFAGAFCKMFKNAKDNKTKLSAIIIGSVLGGLLKYACHVLSGGLFWLGDGSSKFMGVANDSWAYSFIYNGAYCIPNIIICTIIMVILAKFYQMIFFDEKDVKVDYDKLDEEVNE